MSEDKKQVPSVGRMVHYRSYGTPGGEFTAECRAAIITDVGGGGSSYVGLCVLNPTGMVFNRGIRYSEDHEPSTWHWPERVGPQ